MLELDDKKPAARVSWKSKSDNEVVTDALHNALTSIVSATTSTASTATANCAV